MNLEKNVTIVYIPRQIETILRRNELEIGDITDTSKIANVLSHEDIAVSLATTSLVTEDLWRAVFPNDTASAFNHNGHGLAGAFPQPVATLAELDYIKETAKRLLAFDRKSQDLLTTLKKPYTAYIVKPTDPYAYVVVVLDTGFLNWIVLKDNQLSFIRDHIKAISALVPISSIPVANKGLFRLYVELV